MTPGAPMVSVLMPCFNASATLPAAIDSLVKQTLVDFEVVAVDDGSSDLTLKLLRSWQQSDGRVRVLQQMHAGIISALNNGLASCQAEFVARMDGDDICHPERLERQVGYLQAHPEVGVVSCRVTGFPVDQVRTGFQLYLDWLNSLMDDADIRREIFVESPLPHPSVVFRRSLVEMAGGYQDRGWPEDYDLWLRLYLAGVSFVRLPEELLSWREHAQRLTRTDSRYSLENFLRAKAFYLVRGPLAGRETVIIWGAGMMGRRLGKQLARVGAPLAAYADIDPRKIGGSLQGLPVLSPDELLAFWQAARRPVILAAVGARGAKPIIRRRFESMNLDEGADWWFVA